VKNIDENVIKQLNEKILKSNVLDNVTYNEFAYAISNLLIKEYGTHTFKNFLKTFKDKVESFKLEDKDINVTVLKCNKENMANINKVLENSIDNIKENVGSSELAIFCADCLNNEFGSHSFKPFLKTVEKELKDYEKEINSIDYPYS